MGATKKLMEEQEQQRSIAIKIAVEAVALKSCEYHGIVYDPGGADVESAYRLGNYKFTKGEDGLNVFKTRREMTDTIEEVVKDAAMGCWQCEKLLED